MIDVVYILKRKELSYYTKKKELVNLTYSLRSLEKHVTGIGNIYIIGSNVSYIVNDSVIHIDRNNVFAQNKNEVISLYNFCYSKNGVKKFILMSENSFFTQDVEAKKVPYLFNGKLNEAMKSPDDESINLKALYNTYEILKANKLPMSNFEYDMPMLMDVTKLKGVFESINITPFRDGVCIRSLYANIAERKLSFFTPFVIDRNKADKIDLNFALSIIDNKKFFSVKEKSFSTTVIQLLYKLYPNKSRWEA